MTTERMKAAVVFVAVMALLQIFFEDIMMFFAITRSGPPGLLNSPYVMVGVPLVISLSLLAVLVGGALIRSETLR